MVHPGIRFGQFRQPHLIKRNRQKVELLDRAGEVLCSIEDAWTDGAARSDATGGTQTHNLQLTWKCSTANIPDHIVPESGHRIREEDGTIWMIQSVSLRSSDLTWWMPAEHMRNNSLNQKRQF
jgi:hypothetical protein